LVKKLERVDQTLVFIQRAGLVGYVVRKKKARKREINTDNYKSI